MKKVIYHKVCKWCGKEFETTAARQSYCKDDYGKCPVCGKKVKIKDYYIGAQCCSEECRQKRIAATCLERYGNTCAVNSESSKAKAKKTCLEKYGVEHYTQSDEFKEQFKQTMLERYGVESPLQSDEIKQRVQATNLERYGGVVPTCSPEIMKKSIYTMIERYGGVGLGGSLADKIHETMIERYGGLGSQSDIIKAKVLQTTLERYGVENPLQSAEIKAKVQQTNLERYGYVCALNHPEIKQKAIDSTVEHYGVENPFESEEVKQTIRDTLIERYGVENPMQSESIRQKAEATNLQRYGSKSYLQSVASIPRVIVDPSKSDEFQTFREDVISYIQNNFETNPTLEEVASKIGVTTSTVSSYVIKNNCQKLIKYRPLVMENSVLDALREIDPNMNIIQHNRKLIHPYEIDIYLPEYKLGIECNPSFTHNSTCDSYEVGDVKPTNYHKVKSELAAENGIFLFHIFGWEWTYRKPQVISMLRNLLGKTENKVFARKTTVRELDYTTCRDFLEANHLQGSTTARIRLGLFTESDELVSVMTFNRIRGTLGKLKSPYDSVYELSRFCSKLNYSVIGGASKLFHYFIENFEFDRVVSFSDVAHTRGKLYSSLGFSYIHLSEPGYYWAVPSTEFMVNRVSAQKNQIRSLFPNEMIDIENLTENQIMVEHGFVKVYDCGKVRWQFTSNL